MRDCVMRSQLSKPIVDGWTFPPLYIGRVHLVLEGIRCNFLGLFGSRQKLVLANSGDPALCGV